MIKKFELGPGNRPEEPDNPDWIRMDIRNLPHVKYVGSGEKIPIPENEIKDLFFSRYVIEHFSWRKVKDVLKEWYRVMAPGCKIEFHTNDVDEIVRQYQLGYIDNGWFNYVIFGGQDYEGNFHYSLHNFEHFRKLMEEIGFKDIKRNKVYTWEERKKKGKEEKYCPMMIITAVK